MIKKSVNLANNQLSTGIRNFMIVVILSFSGPAPQPLLVTVNGGEAPMRNLIDGR